MSETKLLSVIFDDIEELEINHNKGFTNIIMKIYNDI